ncbi:TolC family outer membrane protein [Paucibacter sp. R3-3]|uniref:TolC family outer membrane protein n=1 Tax=Roseateles agri TaxID=3098619 RepID=A0ABU5DFZ9_9BURK|nr:TolC family outer membrane protein [Paucibacter sp. R3-3]MDY0745059.1 TolC family outer membrane protein [Paucibacter sp. R3-3]
MPMRLSMAFVAVALALPAASRAEDLLQVYAEARAKDPTLAAADAARGVQREVAVQARAPLLPQWSAGASETHETGPEGGRLHQFDSSISQVLLDLSKLRGWQSERTLVSAQDAAVQAAEQDLCARVASAYFGLLSAQATLRTTQQNEEAFEQQVQQAQARFDAGLSAQVDVDQAKAYYQLSRGATVQARQAVSDAQQALAQITGREPGTLQPLVAELPPLPPEPADAQAWVTQSLRNNPQILVQDLTLKSSEQRIAAARAGHLPTLSLGVDSLNQRGAGIAPSDNGRTITQLGLRLNIPIFAGGAVESQTRQAVYQREAQRDQLEIVQRSWVRETQAQYQSVVSGIALMQSARDAVAASDRMLASTRAGQPLGTRTMTDLLLAIQTQASAQNAFEQARHGYVLAKLLLQRAAGNLNESELAAVNRLLVSANKEE